MFCVGMWLQIIFQPGDGHVFHLGEHTVTIKVMKYVNDCLIALKRLRKYRSKFPSRRGAQAQGAKLTEINLASWEPFFPVISVMTGEV